MNFTKNKKFKFSFIANFLLFINFLPFVIMSFYNHPASDDYWFGNYNLKQGLFYPMLEYYYNGGGRLTMALALSFDPLRFENIYMFKIIPIISIFLFFASIWFMISKTIKNIERSYQIFIALGLSILYISILPSPFEAIYWYPSISTYLLGFVLININFAFINYKDKPCSDFKLVILINVVSIMIVCVSELVAVVWIFFIIFKMLADIFLLGLNFRKNNFLLFIGPFIGFIVLLTAPGLLIRQAAFPHSRDFVFSLREAFLLSPKYFFCGISFNVILFSFLLAILSKERQISKDNYFYKKQIIFFIPCIVLGTFTVFFILAWANGLKYLPARVINLIAYYQLPLYLICLYSLFKILLDSRIFKTLLISQKLKNILITMLFLSLLLSYNSYNAIEDLVTGRAIKFDELRKFNYKQLKAFKNQIVYLKCPEEIPDTFASPHNPFVETGYHINKYFSTKGFVCD